MDRFDRLLSINVSSELGIVLFSCLLIFFLTPVRKRLAVALFLMALTQTLARLRDLQPLSTIAAVAITPCYILALSCRLRFAILCARLNAWAWLIMLTAAWSILCVSRVSDSPVAMLVQAQWLLLTIAASFIASAVSTQSQLLAVLQPIFYGLATGTTFCLAPILVDPASAVSVGYGRFAPYGSNPNQIALTFATVAALGLYFCLRATHVVKRIGFGFFGILGILLTFASLSRMAFLIVCFTGTVFLAHLSRRPLYSAVIACSLLTVIPQLLIPTLDLEYSRIDGQITRHIWWESGISEFLSRPVFGLLGTVDMPVLESKDNFHNAFLALLYIGGLTIGIPLFSSQLAGLRAAALIWWQRARSGYDPLLVSVLFCLMLTQSLSGFVNDIIYYPAYNWAFLNVFGIVFFTTQTIDRQAMSPLIAGQNRHHCGPCLKGFLKNAKARRSHTGAC